MSYSPALVKQVKRIHRDVETYSQRAGKITLRPYQAEFAHAIVNSVIKNLGLSFVVIITRQGGKNETQAQIESYLLSLFRNQDVGIVKVSPTFKPQTLNAMQRLEDRLKINLLTKNTWRKRSGYQYLVGRAGAYFFSGDKRANVVGATASLLLEVDEAQDVSPAKYDKDFAPMAAAYNATRVFWGTAWTSNTLLARARQEAEAAEKLDGIRRVFIFDADHVRKVLPAYGLFVDGEIARLGRNHPLVRTQYFCEEIDAQVGMFNAGRMALIATQNKKHDTPQAGSVYAFLVDVAGQDEAVMSDPGAELSNAGRDSVTLSIVEIDLSTIEIQSVPSYTVVHRQAWTGQNHLAIFGKLKSLANNWGVLYMVMDATGVGEGLWAMLDKALPEKVIPVKFSSKSKSEIGWAFLSIIETGRFHDATDHAGARKQYIACVSEIKPGPAKLLSWSVPENARDAEGLLIHDDYLLADALVAKLDELEWDIGFKSTFIETEFSQ